MCDHSTSTYTINATNLRPVPTDPQKCHIYYVHQKGEILCEPDVQFETGEDTPKQVTSLDDPDKNKGRIFCGEDRLTLM